MMKNSLIVACLLLTCQLSAQQLSLHQWKNRLIIIVDKTVQQLDLKKQLAILEGDKVGLNDRKLIVYQFGQNQFKTGLALEKESKLGKLPKQIQRRMKDDTLFSVFLIGLDGGIKMQKNKPVSLSQFFGLIDRMPMRQNELDQQKRNIIGHKNQ